MANDLSGQFIGINIKQKVRLKIQQMNIELNFVGVMRLFVLVYANEGDNAKKFNRKSYLPNDIIKNYNVIINGNNFYNQAIDSERK